MAKVLKLTISWKYNNLNQSSKDQLKDSRRVCPQAEIQKVCAVAQEADHLHTSGVSSCRE